MRAVYLFLGIVLGGPLSRSRVRAGSGGLPQFASYRPHAVWRLGVANHHACGRDSGQLRVRL